jgi:hypothetical protein
MRNKWEMEMKEAKAQPVSAKLRKKEVSKENAPTKFPKRDMEGKTKKTRTHAQHTS